MQIHLDKWQKELLEYNGHILLCTGRRVGKTYIMAVKSVEEMMKRPNIKIVVVSLSEDQAKLIIAFAQNYARQKYKKFMGKGVNKPTQRSLTLNKSLMLARPCGNTGDAVRGFEGDILIIDEASRFPEIAFTAATPVLMTTGGKIWMCSTPFGKQGYFYKNWLNKEGRFRIWHLSSMEVINDREISPSWSKERKKAALQYLEEEREDMSELEFGQEYEGRFLEDLQQFFPDALTQKCQTAQRPNVIARGRDFYLGVDIGRYGNDPSTFEIFRRTQENRLIQVESQETKKTLLTQTADHIIGLDTNYGFRKMYVDDEGIGIGVFDILISTDQTKRRTEALRNSKKIIDYKNDKKTKMQKELLYMNLLNLMEKGQIELLGDNAIFQSFKSVQYEYTKDKKGKPFLHIFGNDAHHVEGATRAAWCTKDKSLKPWVDYF